ncbi:MAG: glycosyltransferase [Atopobiaceae bacterium]|nr:glycosyltransferase [Atopobiaceae bacterium]
MRLSVIVPVYNLEELVGECLSSICASTSSDFEVLCVNDGSTDGSSRVLHEWAERDPRIHVIDQEDKGVSNARNAGIAIARGDYLTFVDGDDRLAPGGLDLMLHACERLGCDVISFGASTFPEGFATDWLKRHLKVGDVAPKAFSADMVLGEDASPFMWGRVYRRSLVMDNDIRFAEHLSLGEDVCWLASCLPLAHRAASVSSCVYEYRLARSGSLMTQQSKGSKAQLEKHLDVVDCVYDTWDAYGICDAHAVELADWAIRYVFYAVARQGDDVRQKLVVRMRDIWREHRVDTLHDRFPREVRGMVDLALSYQDDGTSAWSPRRQSLACLVWRIYEYGLRDLAETALGRGGSRSGSGE